MPVKSNGGGWKQGAVWYERTAEQQRASRRRPLRGPLAPGLPTHPPVILSYRDSLLPPISPRRLRADSRRRLRRENFRQWRPLSRRRVSGLRPLAVPWNPPTRMSAHRHALPANTRGVLPAGRHSPHDSEASCAGITASDAHREEIHGRV